MKIVVIDYGLGNLFSVKRALEVCGADDVCISDSAKDIANADRVILPGVGAFADGMKGLRERGLIEPIQQYAETGKPLMGICLGMQLLASVSEEFGCHQGLGLIPGRVVAIPSRNKKGEKTKVPFIGWASLRLRNLENNSESCLHDVENQSVYFVHSYHVLPENKENLIASYTYSENKITAAIRSVNITGLQFHPEKSAKAGLHIISNFLLSEN